MKNPPKNQSRDDLLFTALNAAKKDGVIHRTTEHERADGPRIQLDGQALTSFASCSYLGLEQDARLIAGAQAAAARFGTQFSSSRAYVSLGLYQELEATLSDIMERPAVVFASTSLGHLSALPTLVDPRDAVILDQQVHASVFTAAQLPKARGAAVHVVRHNDMAQLEALVGTLAEKHRRVWYLADGIYSMHGDAAPLVEIEAMLERHPSMWLYIDDAHGFGWKGARGCGHVRSVIDHHPRMILAVSLNKSFACAGGAIVFPDAATAERVRTCGGTYIFSGPIQPPMLGAAIESVRLHTSDAIIPLQAELADKIAHCHARLEALGLPQIEPTDSPIFFVPTGPDAATIELSGILKRHGFLVNVAGFPAVPKRQGGLRFTIHRLLSTADIDAMLECLAEHYGAVLARHGLTAEEMGRLFRRPDLAERLRGVITPSAPNEALVVRHARTIRDVDAARWDAAFAGRTAASHELLQSLEDCFADCPDPKNRWDFHYLQVSEANGRPILDTFFVVSLAKDDVFADAEVSRRLEALRVDDPDLLVSRTVCLGSPVNVGDYLALDRKHPRWADAVKALVERMRAVKAEAGATQILLRDFPMGADAELTGTLEGLGFMAHRLPDRLMISDLSWTDRADYLARLGQKYRYNVRKEALAFEQAFDVDVSRPTTDAEIDAVYALYREVHARGLEVNVFPLPRAYFETLCAHTESDIIRLFRKADTGADRRPVAVMFSNLRDGRYTASIVGLDYHDLAELRTYKQVLFQTVQRAAAVGAHTLDLGFTADLEKKKMGATPVPTCAFVAVDDHYAASVMESLEGAA